ncbi:MAG: hypothetical protein ABFD94_00140, partial [Armatimonadia bacterium]
MASADEERLASALVDSGVLSAEQLEEARQASESSGMNLVQTLLRQRLVTAADIAQAASAMPAAAAPEAPQPPEPAAPQAPARPAPPQRTRPISGGGKQSLASYEIDPEALRDIPRSVAERYHVLPLQISADRILVAMADASNVFAMDEIRSRTGRRVEPIEVAEEEINQAIDQYYAHLARAQVN